MGPISIFAALQDAAMTSKTKANSQENGPSCPVTQKYQLWKEIGCVSP